MDSFVTVKAEAKEKGLTVAEIVKVLELIEFANDNDVEMYLEKCKLRMKSTIEPAPKKTGKSDDNFGNIFDSFKDIFNTKK